MNFVRQSRASIAAAALCLVVAVMPLLARADSDEQIYRQAVDLYNRKNFDEARRRLIPVVKRNPGNSLYWFNLGAAAYMAKNYKDAHVSFSRVIALGGPLANAALWYRAKTLRDANRSAHALKDLDQLLARNDVTPVMREQATADREQLASQRETTDARERALSLYKAGKFHESLSVLSKIRDADSDVLVLKGLVLQRLDRLAEAQRVLRRVRSSAARDLLEQMGREASADLPYWLFIDAAAGHDNNIYLDGAGASPRSATVLKSAWGFGGRPYVSGYDSVIVSYLGAWDEAPGFLDLQVVSHQLLASYSHETPSFYAQAGAYIRKDFWAATSAFTQYGLKSRVRQSVSTYDLGADLDIGFRKEDESQYSYLAGTLINTRLYAGVMMMPLYVQAFVDIGDHRTGDSTYSNGNVLPVAKSFYGPGARLVWRMTSSWILSAQLSYLQHAFKVKAQPGNKERVDQEMTALLRVTRNFSDSFSGYLAISGASNSSTLGQTDVVDKNYSNLTSTVGLLWEAM